MSRPRISCFLPSYNKHEFAVEAVQSVIGQDSGDWELFLLENSTDGLTRALLRDIPQVMTDARIHYDELDNLEEIRGRCYITSWLLNQHYPRAGGDFIFYLSDDDVLAPEIFGEIARYFDDFPDRDALYFSMARASASYPGDGLSFESQSAPILALEPRGQGRVDGQIDGGQVSYRKSLLARLDPPWFPEDKDPGTACHSDGLFLNRITGLTPFYPLPVYGVQHRMTPLSTWTKG